MKCPIDASTLSVASREGVDIDYCPQCRGVWLDRGELDKIIDRAAAAIGGVPVTPPPASALRDEDRRYGSRGDGAHDGAYAKRRRRRRSFLDDLFDFD